MIWESREWKLQLARDAATLEKLASSVLREKNLVAAERIVFLSAYTLRKLAEARKVSDVTAACRIPVLEYPRIPGTRLGLYDRYDVPEYFDMTAAKAADVGLLYLCNQIIHSFVFAFVMPRPKCIQGFLVTSDRDKEFLIREFSLGDFRDAMKRFSADYPTSSTWRMDGGKEIIEVNP